MILDISSSLSGSIVKIPMNVIVKSIVMLFYDYVVVFILCSL